MDIISKELSDILEVLRAMAIFETKVAELYSVCALTWDEDREFWLDIWRDEVRHAQYITKIIEIVLKNPDLYKKGHLFDVIALQTTTSDIINKIEEVKRGEISKNAFLLIANNLEQGIIEKKYGEVVTTNDIEYTTLMEKIIKDTEKHNKKIIQKIKEIKQEKERP
jgi:hypothetical protein